MSDRTSKWLVPALTAALVGCGGARVSAPDLPFSATVTDVPVGGRPAVTLKAAQFGDRPQILEVEILPGRGMYVHQARAWLPGKGVIAVMEAPPIGKMRELMAGGPEDLHGNQSFRAGGAILLPFANRIRGAVSADGKTVQTGILGKSITLPANWRGKNPEAEPHSMHGLILASPVDDFTPEATSGGASVSAKLNAGDFGGHWLSKTEISFQAGLDRDGFALTVTARNAGNEPAPVGIGWHPYFTLPSGRRGQARLRLPAAKRALVNNYDDVFPTGRTAPTEGTAYDFSASGGAPLGELFLDDCFFELERKDGGPAVAEVIDPAAGYGLRIAALSPAIKAFQVYAPLDKAFVVVEPQFNLADPFSKIWSKGTDTGMVVLEPGQSVTYSVRLEVFQP
jgi:galactose mutarotase-like enzyme